MMTIAIIIITIISVMMMIMYKPLCVYVCVWYVLLTITLLIQCFNKWEMQLLWLLVQVLVLWFYYE